LEYMDDFIKVRVLNGGCIYHYTTVQALQGILENEELWATKSDFLNDKMEFKYTYELFEKSFLKNIKNEIFCEKLIGAFRFEIDKNESHSELLNGFYVLSFSTNSDNLLLWSEFSNSMGYNLGFRFTDLKQSFQKNLMWHGEVIYERDTQLSFLKESLDDILTQPDFSRSINDFDENTSDSTIADLANHMYLYCAVYSMFFKQPEFAPEKEYRFVISAIHEATERNKTATKMYFRVKEDTLIPYIKVPCKPLNALQSITIGPKNNIDIAIEGIKCFCKENRIEVPMLKSNIPLRY